MPFVKYLVDFIKHFYVACEVLVSFMEKKVAKKFLQPFLPQLLQSSKDKKTLQSKSTILGQCTAKHFCLMFAYYYEGKYSAQQFYDIRENI